MLKRSLIYNYQEYSHLITFDVQVPFHESVEELGYIILSKYHLPLHKSPDLVSFLRDTLEKYNLEYYQARNNNLLESCRSGTNDLEDLTRQWEKLLRNETVEYGDNRFQSEEEVFAATYHKLVHSSALETMFQVEHMYGETVKEHFSERNEQMNALTERQTKELSIALDSMDEGITEAEINEISTKHVDEQTFFQVQFTSELETIKEAQRREYRTWLIQLLEQQLVNSSLPTPKNSPLTPVLLEPFALTGFNKLSIHTKGMEDSFTIHLGSQLKQMHNIRVFSRNVLELCAHSNSGEMCPQLLQTALGLYSNDLCGLVLMTDKSNTSRFGKEFMDICESSTEFHFRNFDNQLDRIYETSRQYQKSKSSTKIQELLQLGDVYITKHSNLSQVHVIFHVISNDSVRGTDINSRHPIVLGLRNVLKAACSHHVSSITIPLLLQYEMSEEMTVVWCTKRAELVFKCVKGFMIEMASWGGSDLKTIQFLVPEEISCDAFQALTAMLPSIFKVSTPLILTSNSSMTKQ